MLQGVYGIRQLVEYAEHKDKIHLSPALTSNLISVLLAFVTSGQGVTLLPPCSVTAELARAPARHSHSQPCISGCGDAAHHPHRPPSVPGRQSLSAVLHAGHAGVPGTMSGDPRKTPGQAA
jgi:DNA-binding transcriptional LysR family regulator